jgi:1,4-alpha-glucan branching enzyme
VPTVVANYRIGVPQAGTYHERLNTDSAYYGGSNQGTPFGCATAEPVPWNGQPFSIVVTLPPLAMVAWECD